MSLTTPVRSKSAAEMSNESPLPTPPQAMHDLLRNGRVAAAAAARSSLAGQHHPQHPPAQVVESSGSNHRQSSSPSARAGARAPLRVIGPNRSPSSLALSMGALPPPTQHRHAHALGSQMGIVEAGATPPEKPTRPGALPLASQRSASYENAGSPARESDEGGVKTSARPSFMSLSTTALLRDSNKENLGGHQRRISSARRSSARRTPSPTSAASGEGSNGSGRGSHRQSLGEREKSLEPSSTIASRGSLRRSSDEASAPAASSRRRQPEEEQERPLADRGPGEHAVGWADEHGNEDMDPPNSNAVGHYVTPGMPSGARVLRSGHAPKQAAAPWSVGRSIKRIGEWRCNGSLHAAC